MKNDQNKKWWHGAIGYQIYPKSYQDTNSDGIGDIKGIIQHLDDLKELGISVIWVSPINLSPMVDHGYDISDYLKIDPQFGTNEDFKLLIEEAKKREIKILMDLVINHTSSEHVWFKKAMENLNGDYANYYVIKEGKGNQPPNNWRSIFGGSAWEKIANTNKYYLHLFTPNQPDLNWENPKLRRELYKIIDYWLDKGISGYRIDAISHIKKIYPDKNLKADGPDGLVTTWEQYRDAEGIGEFLEEMRDRAFKNKDILTIAEMDVASPEKWHTYFGENGYFSSIFDFYHTPYSIQQDKFKHDPIKLIEELKKNLFERQILSFEKDVFFTNFIENHDLSRSLNRFIPKEDINFYSASVLGIFYFFLRGIPVIYQGQEIGMEDFPKTTINEYIDLATHNSYKDYRLKGYTDKEAMNQINIECRENSRTPMQWSNEKYAGFSKKSPWFAVNPNYLTINYDNQSQNPHSLLNFYKKLIALRTMEDYKDLFVYGMIEPTFIEIKGCVAFYRIDANSKILVICNMTKNQMDIPFKNDFTVLLNNYDNLEYDSNIFKLQSYQGIVIQTI